ncbi:hypothetical protein BT67DRAFT_127017 [Trichocladium antarcticum]|uniref:Uncharacterized protein n=1 Tax=Trichocladium antarcticum TaxID=1450529 RepID=A0AAN6URN4_9PEZI|nr:hypothetical protein BT67DRAFT_127017 [Trichocladium antarcticum]
MRMQHTYHRRSDVVRVLYSVRGLYSRTQHDRDLIVIRIFGRVLDWETVVHAAMIFHGRQPQVNANAPHFTADCSGPLDWIPCPAADPCPAQTQSRVETGMQAATKSVPVHSNAPRWMGQKAPGRGRRGSSTAAAPCAVPLHGRVRCNSGQRPKLWLTSPRADPRALLDVPGIAAVACVRQGCARLSHWQQQGPVLQLDTPRDPPSSETSHIAGGPSLNGLPSVPIVLRDAAGG